MTNKTCTHLNTIRVVKPSARGCEECLKIGSPWLHLRLCRNCGHVGCCDSSPSQHARAHSGESGHPYVQSFEPGEDWFFDYRTNDYVDGPSLSPPRSHPADQPVPGPAGTVPPDWQRHLN
jgi:hypothetical protein